MSLEDRTGILMHRLMTLPAINTLRSKLAGWTLIELAIVLIILAIIVTLAYPAYNDQVIKARRADGKALLYEAAQREQQFFTVNNRYGDLAELGISDTSLEGYYTLSVAETATTFTVTATRVAPQTADTKCGDLTLNHLGVKGVVNATLPAAECW